ncbi:hypothetical protein [Ramlibacter montanisoli]|jgi:hypothetical protein|uniref:Uncharacterized protein n=1 Tax=Ramlibacter montanisoli TaxID=2732512 RepID=A0A849KE38_9BURK|nr:hypothetical protein [Ramlibacter montanisoli]NNU44457.1 hypothetical protein [Ramlibacter montanisoli]
MTSADYRIESTQPIAGRFWPAAGSRQLSVKDRALAISLAAKSFTRSSEIRVVHVPTGEVVFRKPPHRAETGAEDF